MKRTDNDYDYSASMKAITPESVRETLIDILQERDPNFDPEDEANKENIEYFVKRKMFSLWEDLHYMEENNENDIYDILDGNYE